MTTKKVITTPPLITYAPEVEAMREKYHRIGAGLRDLLNMVYSDGRYTAAGDSTPI